jgi:hypothetical protein
LPDAACVLDSLKERFWGEGIMSESHLRAAEYFDDRAKRARYPEERVHFLELVQKYRELAAGEGLETELPKRPPAPSVRRGDAAASRNRPGERSVTRKRAALC